MQVDATSALWLAPLALPICMYVAYTDMRFMRITNQAVMALTGVFLVVGLVTLPLPDYGMRLVQLVVVLLVGMALNAAGIIGAGDAKFAAAAAPFIHLGDLTLLMMLFAAVLAAAFVTHRLARISPLRGLAPEWESWARTRDFPMGLALGPTLALYLVLGAVHGT